MPALEQLFAVAAVFSLLGLALWFAKRKGALLALPIPGRRQQPLVRVTHRVALTAQHCLHVVEAGGAVLLVGTHPGGLVIAPPAGAFELELRRACSNTTEAVR